MTPAVPLRFVPYCGGPSQLRDVPAMVRGDLAVHRPGYLDSNASDAALSALKDRWTVSHVPTGSPCESAIPQRFNDRGKIIATQRDLLAWCEAWQAACPDFFDAVRSGDATDCPRELAQRAREIGKAL